MSTGHTERKPTRTFGQLIGQLGRSAWGVPNADNACRFCGVSGRDTRDGLAKYNTRHYICGKCIKSRENELLPHIAKAERIARRLCKERKVSGPDAVRMISRASKEYCEQQWAAHSSDEKRVD